jgi:AraC family transcriptional regulator
MDVFGEFVEMLTETLDDHEASAQTFANRLHLSRFHFTRLVSAVTGEPPAAFRRRILLERAAYHLLTTDADVLEIAVDAGYSSHEAFTRAFRRGYGETPSRWRRSPSSFRIEAPSDVHFNPPGGLRLPAQRKVSTMDLMTRMVEHHVWLVGELVERAAALPEAAADAPITLSVEGIDDDPTMRSLLARLVGQLEMWVAAIDGRPYDFAVERGEPFREMKKRLAAAGPAFLADVRTIVAEDRLDETFVDAVCDPPEVFTYGGMVAHVLTFGAHRRTLVLGALTDAGVTDLGAGDPMRWVAEAA